MEPAKLVITGGNGCIGREIGRLAMSMGHHVISVSRTGAPRNIDEPWIHGIRWITGDARRPEMWAEHLRGCDAVVHCVGIAREIPARGVTFEAIHRDAAAAVAEAADAAGVGKFVLLSAATTPPLIASRYLATKRAAERALAGHRFAWAILRPALVLGPYRPGTTEVAMLPAAATRLPFASRWLGAIRPLRLERVAIAGLRAALEPEITGVLDVDAIAHLGDAMMIQ